MVAKLVIGLVVLTVLVAVAVIASFWYFKHRAEMKHDREMAREERRADLDEQLVEVAESETGIDAELEREKKR